MRAATMPHVGVRAAEKPVSPHTITCSEIWGANSNVAALHLLLAEGYNRKGNKWNSFLEGLEAVRLKALGF